MKGVLFMAKYKVDISGINTSSLKPLTNEQNLELFKKMQEGDPFARDDLINGNLKLVLSILKKFNNKVDNLDDLFQVGCLGLVKAIDNLNIVTIELNEEMSFEDIMKFKNILSPFKGSDPLLFKILLQ